MKKRLGLTIVFSLFVAGVFGPCLFGAGQEEQSKPASLKAQDKTATPAARSEQKKADPSVRPIPPPHRGYARRLLEEAALIVSSTIDYWRTYANFREDWQFAFTWRDQTRRLFSDESPRFDSNSYYCNWTHAISGAGYYSIARANGADSRVSFLYSLGMSAIWEYISEWREVVSINDMTITPFAGPAIGEPLFQVSSYFSHKPGLLNALASFIFDPALAINNWMDRKRGPAVNSDPGQVWHRFSLFLGSRSSWITGSSEDRDFNFGLQTETNTVPGLGQGPSFEKYFSGTLSSRTHLDFSTSRLGLDEYRLRTQAVLLGYAWQVSEEADGAPSSGRAGYIGFGSSFDIYQKRATVWYDSQKATENEEVNLISDARFVRPTPTDFKDKMAAVSLLGPVLELDWFRPGLRARWTSEAYLDFALVNALAYNLYSEDHDVSGVKSTLLNWGYYYGLGTRFGSDAALDWKILRVAAGLQYQAYASIQGLDRFQFLGAVTEDFRLVDTRFVRCLELGLRLPWLPVEFDLAVEGIGRTGRILGIRAHTEERRTYLQMHLLF